MIKLLPVSLFLLVPATAEVSSYVAQSVTTSDWAGIFFNSLALAAIFVPVLIWQTRRISLLEAELKHLHELMAERQHANPIYGVEEEMMQEPPRLGESFVELYTVS